MKSFITAIVLAISILVGGISYRIYLDDITKELIIRAEKITQSVLSEDYEIAQTGISALEDFIEEKRIALASTLDHSILDKIETNLAELKAYAACHQQFDSLAKCEPLNLQFKHLPKNYKVRPENIL